MKTPNPTLPANTQAFGPISAPLMLRPGCVRYQAQAGRFVANRYEGEEFRNVDLQSRAETGLWYCYATGTGLGLAGEGSTPENALANLRARAEEMRAELVRVYGLKE